MTSKTITHEPAGLRKLVETSQEKLLTCVHCGLCLPACPTYRVLGDENDSPRGRIYLMRALVEDRIDLGSAFISHIDRCLGCRGCETVCPSGVPYGQLIEAARVEVSAAGKKRLTPATLAVSFVLNQVFTRPRILASVLALGRFIRDSGLARLALDADLFGGKARFALALLLASRSRLERIDPRLGRLPEATRRPSKNAGPGAGCKVATLRGCVMEGLFRKTNRATENVLVQNGCDLIEIPDQVCCGALHAHAGEIEAARALARKNITAFLEPACDRIIVNSAGCGAAMKDYAELLADDPEFSAKAREFSLRVRDISEFLVEVGIRPPAARIECDVTYDAPCHLRHAQRIIDAPVSVLKAIPGVRYTPLEGSDSCCGGAGIYNLQHPGLSADILFGKIRNINATTAKVVATPNPGCIMQIGAGVLQDGLDIVVLHPVELLDAAYALEYPRE